ncbi:hypothetical protein H4R35_000937 [Dimargaris xerosporica]|nr:hypothetical protein H4R35_000937 [Dimargaris xerosporica]
MAFLTFIRHGESESNRLGRIQGQHDSLLSALGHLQIRALGQCLQNEQITELWASDLRRATETAQAIVEKHDGAVPLKIDPRLREQCYGELEGMAMDDGRVVEVLQALRRCDRQQARAFRWPGPNGESVDDVLERGKTVLGDALGFLASRLERPSGELAASSSAHLVVVAHGLFLQELLEWFLLQLGTPARTPFVNTGIWTLELTPSPRRRPLAYPVPSSADTTWLQGWTSIRLIRQNQYALHAEN